MFPCPALARGNENAPVKKYCAYLMCNVPI